MNATNPAAVSALLVLAIGSSAQAGGQVLLFETFDNGAPGWAAEHIDQLGGWRNTGGNPGACFILNEFGQPHLDPQLTRTLSGLVPGRMYRIEGDFKDFYNMCANVTGTSFRVDVDGVSIFSSGRALQWARFSGTWIASATQSVLRIRAETDGTDCDAVVDNITVTEVLPCAPDVTGNYVVDAVDLSVVLSAWGTSGQSQFNSDITNDGTVDGEDLAYVLSGWGPCP
jgi:hypothetical protein